MVFALRGTAMGLLVALVAVGAPVAAEQPPLLAPGTRVRVTVASPESRTGADVFVGQYRGRNDAALWLEPGQAPAAIPLGQLRGLEVSLGRKPSILRVAIGSLIGATVGFFAVGCLANRDSYGVLCLGQDDSKFIIGAVVGGLAGAAIGAWLFPREEWQSVPR
jgi:hypothetical protein